MANKSQFTAEKYSKNKMLDVLEQAIEQTERYYQNTLFDKNKNGETISFKRAVDLRAKLKKDLCIMYLIRELTENVKSDFMIESDQAQLGFERLALS